MMMDRIPSLSLPGLSLSHHPLSQLQSQSLTSSANSSTTAALNQQALNSLNFHHQQTNHSHNQLNQNLNHSLISSSNNVGQTQHHHHPGYQQQTQSQLHSTNLHHHQQLNGLLNNVGANGWVFAMNLKIFLLIYYLPAEYNAPIPPLSNRSSTIFSLLTSTSLMKKQQEDHIKRPMNAFMVSERHLTSCFVWILL